MPRNGDCARKRVCGVDRDSHLGGQEWIVHHRNDVGVRRKWVSRLFYHRLIPLVDSPRLESCHDATNQGRLDFKNRLITWDAVRFGEKKLR